MKERSVLVDDFPGPGWHFGGVAGDWGADDLVAGYSADFAALDGVGGELSADEDAEDVGDHEEDADVDCAIPNKHFINKLLWVHQEWVQ